MQAPVRLLLAVRPSVRPALLVATAASTAVFVATPFLVPGVADEFDVSVAAGGWTSTAQLAGFVIASWVGGRFLRPVRSVFVVAALMGVVANGLSAVSPTFEILCVMRFGSGLALGLNAWFAWQDAFGDAGKTGDVAVVGPLVGSIVAPTASLAIETIGVRGLFTIFAVLAAVPLVFVGQVERNARLRPHETRHAATRAARVILLALGMVTFAGSAVFVYGAAIGIGLDGMSAFAVSLAYAGNNLASIPAAKWYGRRGPAGIWFAGIAVCTIVICTSRDPIAFSIAIVAWGFVFFMGIPAVFGLLAARSHFPEERAGDAQATMALGRVFGPLLGGYFLANDAIESLGFVAAGILVSASILLLYVDRQRFVVARQWPRRRGLAHQQHAMAGAGSVDAGED